jgi:hypothetical protein
MARRSFAGLDWRQAGNDIESRCAPVKSHFVV